MNTGDRLWRIARRQVIKGLGAVQDLGSRAADAAREELEEFLRANPHGTPTSGTGTATRPSGTSSGPQYTPPSPPPSTSRSSAPPPHPYQREYRLLGAPVGAEFATVQQCWRKRVRETHPDRFASDPAAQKQASERLREVNEAYERLKKYLGG